MRDPNLTEFFNSKIPVWCSLSNPTGICFNALSRSLPLLLATLFCAFIFLLPHLIPLIWSCLSIFSSNSAPVYCMSVCHVLPATKGKINLYSKSSRDIFIHIHETPTPPFFSLLKTKWKNILSIFAQVEKPADGRSLLFSNISLIAKQNFGELLYNFL